MSDNENVIERILNPLPVIKAPTQLTVKAVNLDKKGTESNQERLFKILKYEKADDDGV